MPRPTRLTGRSKRLQEALKKAGGGAALGRWFKPTISKQAVDQWTDIPPSRVKRIEQVMSTYRQVRNKHGNS